MEKVRAIYYGKKDSLFSILKFSYLLLFLQSMQIYFFWGMASSDSQKYVFYLLITIIGYLYVSKGKIRSKYNVSLATFLFGVAYYYQLEASIYTSVKNLLFIFPVITIPLMISTQQFKEMMDYISRWMGIILAVSLFFFLLNFVIPIPSFGKLEYEGYNYIWINHLFFLLPDFIRDYSRFQGIFLEPGQMAMICTFLLYYNEYDFSKKRNIVFLLSIIFSFSLAGYVLLILGYVIFKMMESSNKKVILSGVFLIALVTGFYYFSINYKGGNNLFNELIVERLQFGDEYEYGFSGNNRTKLDAAILFAKAVASGDIWVGYGVQTMAQYFKDDSPGAGIVPYLLDRGIIGVLLIFIAYFYLAVSGSNKKYALGMLLFYMVAFYQRATPFWAAWLLPFMAISVVEVKNSVNKLEKNSRKLKQKQI